MTNGSGVIKFWHFGHFLVLFYEFEGFPGPDFMAIFFGGSRHNREHLYQFLACYEFCPGRKAQRPDYFSYVSLSLLHDKK